MKGRWWRRRKRRSRIGETEEGAVCRAGLLWITWSSAGLRIYSSTAAVRGSGVSCMLLPRIAAKHGCGGSICWILDSAASEPNSSWSQRAQLAQPRLSEGISARLHEARTRFYLRVTVKGAGPPVCWFLSDPVTQTISRASSQIKKISSRQSLGRPRAIPAMTSLLRLMGWGSFPGDVTESRRVSSGQSAGV